MIRRRILLGVSVSFFLIVAWSLGTLLTYPSRVPSVQQGEPVVISISRGQSFSSVVADLHKRQMIAHPTLFGWYARIRGDTKRIRAGEYQFFEKMPPRAILDELTLSGRMPQIRVSIPEGKTLREIAVLVNAGKVASEEAILAAATDRALLSHLGIDGSTAEGYLFPDTYFFHPDTPAPTVLRRLVEKALGVFESLEPNDQSTTLTKYGWTREQVITLASIVESEAQRTSEQPVIAGVFVNRLKSSMFNPKLLQTDPSIIYGCTNLETKSSACKTFSGRLRRVHLRDRDNPYNTYVHVGFPPGPIGNPGKSAMAAALRPKQSPYFYFVARNDGTHQFSKTYAEHLQYVRQFQMKR